MGISVVCNWNSEFSLSYTVLDLYNQISINKVKPWPHIVDRLSLNEKWVIFLLVPWFVRKYSFPIDHNVSFLPFSKILRFFINFSKDVTTEQNLFTDMRLFLPFCLLKTALKSEFVGENLLENNVLNGNFFHRFWLFQIKENCLLSRVWGICDLDFIQFFNLIRFEYLYLLDCYKWNVKIRYYELLSFEVDIYHSLLPYLSVVAFKAFTQLDKLHPRVQFLEIDFKRRH